MRPEQRFKERLPASPLTIWVGAVALLFTTVMAILSLQDATLSSQDSTLSSQDSTLSSQDSPARTDPGLEPLEHGAVSWLIAALNERWSDPSASDLEDDELMLAIAALSRVSDEFAGARKTITLGRTRILKRQEPDGLFREAKTTWFAIAALGESDDPVNRTAVERARGALASPDSDDAEQTPAPVEDDSALRSALAFLEANRASAPAQTSAPVDPGFETSDDLAPFAGKPVNPGAAYRELQRTFDPTGRKLGEFLALPRIGGIPQSIHVAARVLSDRRSPRLRTAEGSVRDWPDALLAELRRLKDPKTGAFCVEPGGGS